MPEGPEVRKYADELAAVLTNRPLVAIEARTREAKAWLKEEGSRLPGRRVLRVVSHGKHLLGYIEGGFYFHSHLMMWGRWETYEGNVRVRSSGERASREVSETDKIKTAESPPGRKPEPLAFPEKDRRERARIVVESGAAVLLSAPIFEVGEGDPYQQIENLSSLGPDVLPYPDAAAKPGAFDKQEFIRRLLLPEHLEITIGAALLNQRILAGLGNYLRAEVLFGCGLNPWRKVGELKKKELNCLSRLAPELARCAYVSNATATVEDRKRMTAEPSLVYQPGREIGTRHLVFRRTNLPCLRCGETIKQLRQTTHNSSDGEEERTRIVYFCPKCQGVH